MSDDHLTDFERAGRITASIVSVILRCDGETRSRKWAWRIITGREPKRETNWDMQRGLDHEEDAIASLEAELGVLASPGRFVCHPTLDWLGASPDGFLTEYINSEIGFIMTPIPIEAKCPRVLHSVLPDIYHAQIQTQLECCDAPHGYFVSWTEEGQWVHKVMRDRVWWAEAQKTLQWFWDTYVVPDVEPPKSERRKNVDGRKVSGSTGVDRERNSEADADVGGSEVNASDADISGVIGACGGSTGEADNSTVRVSGRNRRVENRNENATSDAGARAFFASFKRN